MLPAEMIASGTA